MRYKNSLIFDIETDGLLDKVSKLHCLVIHEPNGKRYSFADQAGYRPIAEGLDMLEKADYLIGHNIAEYDIPAIKIVYPQFNPRAVIRDTLIMSRLQRNHVMYKHSLEVWGEKLGEHKTKFETDWKTWSPEMQKYCEQDVVVNEKILWDLLSEDYSEEAIELEHEFASILAWQMRMGVPFNKEAAIVLAKEIEYEYESLKEELTKIFPSFSREEIFYPKRDNKKKGYQKDQPFKKSYQEDFNPGSRHQVIEFLKLKYGWEPSFFTDNGTPVVNGDVLSSLPYPEAKLLNKLFDAKKLLGQLMTGDNAWLLKEVNGRIHGFINHNGAITGRCTHSYPNLAQVPRVGSYRGKECRALFTAEKGYKLVGCDASGLELRNLAHYMATYDNGAYTKRILESDIHTENMKDAGLDTRDQAKTFIYALNYGAGNQKLGTIVKPEADQFTQKEAGRSIRNQFMSRVPAMEILINRVKNVAINRGYLKGLDGRKLHIRESYRALNTLLQGAGAVVMKKATVLQWKEAKLAGIDGYPALHIHDETQNMIREEQANKFAEIAVEAIRETGRHFEYKCPLDGEAKIGNNWAETH